MKCNIGGMPHGGMLKNTHCFGQKITRGRMLSGSTTTIKGTGTLVSMDDHSPNIMISCLKPSDLLPTLSWWCPQTTAQKMPKIENKQKLKIHQCSTQPIWYLAIILLVWYYLWVNTFQYQPVLTEGRHQWWCQATTTKIWAL